MQQSDWPNLVYLLIILSVLIFGVFSRRDLDFKKVFKYLAAWAGVGFVAVALYAYRFEFADFKSRIMGEINPASARFDQDLGELVINISQDGHFYLNVKINGVAVRFMVDTGASDVTLSLEDAKKVGLDVSGLKFSKPYQTANGTAWGASVVLKDVMIGEVKFIEVSASVNSAKMGNSLLGMSFLRRFKKYEFYQDKLVLSI